MWQRYYRRSDKQRRSQRSSARGVPTTFEILPSYNVAPQTFQPVVAFNKKSLERELLQMRWGLVPYWASDPKVGYSTINAKAETLTTSPVFREAIKRRRCLIPADGFYEWQPIDRKNKQPFAFALKDLSLFALAGVFDVWKDKKTGQPLFSYSVITTDPNRAAGTVPVQPHAGDCESPPTTSAGSRPPSRTDLPRRSAAPIPRRADDRVEDQHRGRKREE